MNSQLNIALSAARQAAKLIDQCMDTLSAKDIQKKAAQDFVTRVDQEAEALIIKVLRKAFPSHGILAEESGAQKTDSKYQWIIDPLDGTHNFIQGIPHFAVSIGLKVEQQLRVGVIIDDMRQEEFTAIRGAGAYCNGRRIRVGSQPSIENSILGSGLHFGHWDAARNHAYLQLLAQISPTTAGIRCSGSSALDLCQVACGRYAGYWDRDLKPWDMAAGLVILQEAGGIAGDFAGGFDHLQNGQLICGNPKIFKQLTKLIHPLRELGN